MTATSGPVISPHVSEAAPELRRVPFDAPWAWLGAGWRDLWAAPRISLAYGLIFCVAAYALLLSLERTGSLPLLLPLAGGFLLVGPLLAVGLYEVSRQREREQTVSFWGVLSSGWEAKAQLSLLGMLLLIVNFVWMLTAFLLFMLYFGSSDLPPMDEFIPTLLFTRHGVGLLVTGTIAGAVLAAITYSISAISAPMIFDKNVDVVTAATLSIQAVRLNLPAMLLWAALILALSATGLAMFFVGLAVTFPLIGYATWHAYKDLTISR